MSVCNLLLNFQFFVEKRKSVDTSIKESAKKLKVDKRNAHEEDSDSDTEHADQVMVMCSQS